MGHELTHGFDDQGANVRWPVIQRFPFSTPFRLTLGVVVVVRVFL